MIPGFYIVDMENKEVVGNRYGSFSEAQYNAEKFKELNETNYWVMRIEQVWTTQKIHELLVD